MINDSLLLQKLLRTLMSITDIKRNCTSIRGPSICYSKLFDSGLMISCIKFDLLCIESGTNYAAEES
jgi:hypothetical protein